MFECTISVESSPNSGNKFTNSCKTWREGTYENFKEWVVKQFRISELGSDDEAEVLADMQKAKDISFEKNDCGHFILPPIENHHSMKQRQRIIRAYIGAVYC